MEDLFNFIGVLECSRYCDAYSSFEADAFVYEVSCLCVEDKDAEEGCYKEDEGDEEEFFVVFLVESKDSCVVCSFCCIGVVFVEELFDF